jgi:hypothetical protein
MSNQSDAESQVIFLRSGEAIFSLVGAVAPQVSFLVKERSTVTKYFGASAVEIRFGLIPIGNIMVTVVAFAVGQYLRREYLTWWNYHHAGSAEIFRIMAEQEFLSFYFYGDNGRKERTFVAMNPLREYFAAAIATIAEYPAWSENDFIAARMTVVSSFQTPHSLWDHLQRTVISG